MKTDIEIVAEFMGVDVAPYEHYAVGKIIAIVPKEGCIDWPQLNIYNPDLSWDWLHPVIEKISSIYYADDSGGDNPFYHVDFAHTLLNLPIDTPIEKVYPEVVKSIKWYNENN